jgi:hypothetical protein
LNIVTEVSRCNLEITISAETDSTGLTLLKYSKNYSLVPGCWLKFNAQKKLLLLLRLVAFTSALLLILFFLTLLSTLGLVPALKFLKQLCLDLLLTWTVAAK